ncbi:MAG: tetratricopeptide repeat protein [Planctomycetes bacterium]|nr:tetratricopeptide repeat protein [Planctomycetota bacterium]
MRHIAARLAAVAGLAALGVGRVQAEDAVPQSAPPTTAERVADLSREAVRLYHEGKYAEAAVPARERLALVEAATPRRETAVADAANDLAVVLNAAGAFAEARPLYERALAIREQALGPDHPQVGQSAWNLGEFLRRQGDLAGARRLMTRALAVRERALGPDHLDVALNLTGLASLAAAEADYETAHALHARALAIRERATGKDSLDVAASLNNLGVLWYAEGVYAKSAEALERALAIRRSALGPDHPIVAQTASSLGAALQALGAYARAREVSASSLAARERRLGPDHPDVAEGLNNYAQLLAAQGALAQARPLAERALAIHERALGRDHPLVATALLNVAALLQEQGAYDEARPLLERSLAVREKALGPEHPAVANSLTTLADCLRGQGDLAAARRACTRALAIREKTLGSAHPDVALTLNNLAAILQASGALEEAEAAQRRALAIREQALGPDHPDVAQSLANLASTLRARGDLAAARACAEQALTLRRRALGEDHPDVDRSVAQWAAALELTGADAEARDAYLRLLGATERRARAQLTALSPAQRLAFVRSLRARLDAWLAFCPRVGAAGHAEAMRLRGLVSRAEAAERALVRGGGAADRATLDALRQATRLSARLANEVPPLARAADRARWQRQYAEATAERDRLTRQVAADVGEARAALERLDLSVADVARALPQDTVLVDLLRVGPRYVGWVLRGTGVGVRVELGDAEAIDAASEAFVAAVAQDAGDDASREAVAQTGAALRALVWAPLEAALGDGVRRVAVCPDAALAAVPFGALPGRAPGRALLDDLAVVYVFHPFDLVPTKDAPPPGVGALVVGGVDYDHADVGPKDRPLAQPPPVLAALDRAPRGDAFTAIPATRAEALALRDRFGADATTLRLGADATEARVREDVKGRRFVHVATHGFARTDLLAGLYDRKVKDAFLSADAERMLAVGHDPMLLCGLALAGANPREGGGGDDGVLTALEASYLDLDGVELVTLSACETAKGTAESGEGVLGLVSAFQMAGARRVLASLWKVDDEATRLLMDGVYERLLRTDAPLAPADALREAALALRDRRDADGRRRFAAPRYWAAFVAYGG